MPQISTFSADEERQLQALDFVFNEAPLQPVRATLKQLSIAAKIPIGSVRMALAQEGVTPVFPGSGVYRSGDLARFISKAVARQSAVLGAKIAKSHRASSEIELASAAAAEATNLNKQLLAQPEA